MDPTPDSRPLSVNELAEHLIRLAMRDEDDRANLLCDVIERCWSEQTLRQ